MEISVTILQAGLLRALTWAGGTAEQIDKRLTIRDKIETQIMGAVTGLGIEIGESGAFVGNMQTMLETETCLNLTAADLSELFDAVGVKTWSEVPRPVADVIRALPTWLRTMHQEATDYELVQRLPAERRRALAEVRDGA